MAEQLANKGSLGLIKQTGPLVAGIPTDFVPFYDETLTTNYNKIKQTPIYGGKFNTYATLAGQRDHQGDITVMAEPNTTARFLDMLYTKTSTSGSGPYNHQYDLSITQDPNFYTVDIDTGNIRKRFIGVAASSLTPNWNDNELQHKIKLSALKSFEARTIASVTTNTITLDTYYDAAPNVGLVTNDLVRIYKASTGAILDTTVTTVNADGITVVLGASAAAFAAGDVIYLRPVTPAFNVLPTFLWAKTFFGFGATAASALTNATASLQTQVEQGSNYEILHPFENDGGSKRSGSFDPAALIRLAGDANMSVKRFFDTAEQVQRANDNTKQALVIRHIAGNANQYEFRITFHNLTVDTPFAAVTSNGINYATIAYSVNYDPTDGKAVDMTVLNGLATI